MEKLARMFFVFTLLFAGLFITFFLLYTRQGNDINLLRVERNTAQQQLNTANAQLRRLELSNQELTAQIAQLEEKVATRPGQPETVDPGLVEENERLLTLIEQLETQLLASRREIDQLRAENGQPTGIGLGPTEREADLEKEIARLREEVQVLSTTEDEQLRVLQDRVSQLQQNILAAQREVERYQNQLTARESEIEQLHKQLDLGADTKVLLAAKDQEIHQLQGSITAIQSDLQKAQNQIASLSQQLTEKDRELQAVHQRLQAERSLDPIPAGQEGAMQYKYLIMGEDALLANEYLDSARFFAQARLTDLPLGDLATVYKRRESAAYLQAAAILYNQGAQAYRDEQYNQAIPIFLEALDYALPSQSSYLDHIRYHLGLSFYHSQRPTDALPYLHAVYQNTAGTYHTHALYYLTRIAFESRDYTQAKRYAESLKTRNMYVSYANSVLQEISARQGQP